MPWIDTPNGGSMNIDHEWSGDGRTTYLAIPCNKVGMSTMLRFWDYNKAREYADNPTDWNGLGVVPDGVGIGHIDNGVRFTD